MVVKDLDDLPAAVVASFHPEGSVRTHVTTPVPVDNMTTAALVVHDVVSVGPDGERAWSVVEKVLRPASASPQWAWIPPEHHAMALAELDWTVEPLAYACGLDDLLPDGIRMPALLHLERREERVGLWLERVADAPTWDLERYRTTARALGRIAGSVPAGPGVPDGVKPRSLRHFFTGKVAHVDLPALADPATWSHPAIRPHGAADVGRALVALAERMPAVMDRMDALPATLAHGDACPQNLLREGVGADVVAIDWGFLGTMTIGFDLASLVAGRVETGELDPADLAAVDDAVLAGYQDGLDDVGAGIDPAAVLAGFVGTSLLRSACTAVPVDRLGEDPTPALQELIGRRLAYARHLLDRAAATGTA